MREEQASCSHSASVKSDPFDPIWISDTHETVFNDSAKENLVQWLESLSIEEESINKVRKKSCSIIVWHKLFLFVHSFALSLLTQLT